jgi:type IV secretion system protein VirD4
VNRSAPNDDAAQNLFLGIIVGLFALAAVGNWLVGNAAALIGRGRLLHASLSQAFAALVHLRQHTDDPRLAWSPKLAANLPGPNMYWASAALVVIVAMVICAAVIKLFSGAGRGRHEPVDKRRRLGVSAQARLATTKDLRPLLTRRPESGRFVIARWHRRYLSTEAAEYRRRRGVRGAVAIFGPSQSGKTTGLITGLDTWHGPAIVSSVKADLLRATLTTRQWAGEVKVFDPLGISGISTATWSPLRAAADLRGALAAAQMLARSGGEEGPNDRFWRGQAEQLIAAMLWTAANTEGQSMRSVVKWVLDLDRPGDDRASTLAPLVRLLTDHSDPALALAAKQVQGWLHGQWSTDPRTTSSVYATARNAVWPWADPDVASSADGCDITLDWLLAGNNTLYLCAPLGDETRIGVVFAVVLHDLITQAFDRYNRTGDPLDPRLLILLDEAANTPLPKLPQWSSTVTGAGMQLVTVWQSKAQLDQIYGRDADNVLTNHRTKLIYPSGLSDIATIEYLANLVGTEHVRSDLDEAGWNRAGERPPPRSPSTAVALLTPSVLRQMPVGDAVLLHGELPPAWVQRARQWRSIRRDER